MNLNTDDQSKEFSGLLPYSAGMGEAIFFMGFYLMIFAGPLLQGLYYETEFMPALFLISLLFALDLATRSGKIKNRYDIQALDLAMVGLVIAYLLSLISAVHLHGAVVGLLQVCSYFMIYWLAARLGGKPEGFRGILTAAYLAAIAMCLAGLAAALGWVDWPGFYAEGQIRSTLQYHNALAIYLAAASIIGSALLIQARSINYRLLLAGGNFIMVLVIMGTLSRGTWLLYPLALAAWVFFLNTDDRYRALFTLCWTILCALAAGRFLFAQIEQSPDLALLILLAGLVLSLLAGWGVVWISSAQSIINKYPRKSIIGAAGVIILLLFLLTAFHQFNSNILPQNVAARAQQISLQDGGLKERLDSYRDALSIIRDYPLIGTGGGGWTALYQQYAHRPYYVKEVHNYYLKVAVEAGLLGLCVLLTGAFLFIRMLVRARQQDRQVPFPPMFWGAAMAFVLLALHAATDFELSLPGVAFLFFALLGALRGLSCTASEQPLPMKKGKARDNKPTMPRTSIKSGPLVTLGLWGITIAAMLLASCWVIAYRAGGEGKQALAQGTLKKAENHYHQAVSLDPSNPRYRVGLAMTEARIAAGNKGTTAYRDAVKQAGKAAGMEPYGVETRLNLVKVYSLLLLPQEQTEECKALIQAAPYQPRAYKLAAESLINAAWGCMQQSDMDSAGGYLLQLLEIRASMPGKIKEIPAEVNLAAGQAALLTGRYEEARTYLDEAVYAKNTQATARYWLGILEEVSQESENLSGIVAAIDPDTLRDLMDHR